MLSSMRFIASYYMKHENYVANDIYSQGVQDKKVKSGLFESLFRHSYESTQEYFLLTKLLDRYLKKKIPLCTKSMRNH